MSVIDKIPKPPLAERLRPKNIDDVIGQSHLLGKGKPLQLSFSGKKLHSMILWGPPGVGKTTIARIAAEAFDCEWIALSAVFSGIKNIRLAVEQAEDSLQQGKHTVLFIDEIHRFNKAQQDALLPYTESGLITFIGATTERLGSPEGELALAQAIIYLSIAAKSNAGYVAFNQAMDFVKKDKSREVLFHLRNAPSSLMKKLGHGKKYRYAHNEPHAYAAGENYFPEGIEEQSWYKPVQRGLEIKIAKKISFLKSLDEKK